MLIALYSRSILGIIHETMYEGIGLSLSSRALLSILGVYWDGVRSMTSSYNARFVSLYRMVAAVVVCV